MHIFYACTGGCVHTEENFSPNGQQQLNQVGHFKKLSAIFFKCAKDFIVQLFTTYVCALKVHVICIYMYVRYKQVPTRLECMATSLVHACKLLANQRQSCKLLASAYITINTYMYARELRTPARTELVCDEYSNLKFFITCGRYQLYTVLITIRGTKLSYINDILNSVLACHTLL